MIEKFFIPSTIVEGVGYGKSKRSGVHNPFDVQDKVVITSYDFASQKDIEIGIIPWDLVVIDEAHRLRNVYKPSNVMGKRLQRVLSGKRKLLLTATPLQNSLLELYGLVSIIDEHVFGSVRTFRDMYVSVSNEDTRNYSLKERLKPFFKRTLRKQVTEYVKYTSRNAILQEYTPTEEEEKLYNFVSEYLQSPMLYALPKRQRKLITLVLRKLLASSSFAISTTFGTLIKRLEDLRTGIENDVSIDDYDAIDELKDEGGEQDDGSGEGIENDLKGISEEIEKLKGYEALARSIQRNAKGDNLLLALEKGFDEMGKRGAQCKAVIFTESRRTQEYLFNLLSNNGYEDDIPNAKLDKAKLE
ncbi:hypothetical protein FACS1894184_20600 [Clostridia bacterium]|nr:hypothetical protein FACS1894184_20600 [Clostridia bacterium]